MADRDKSQELAMWLENLTGIEKESRDAIYQTLELQGTKIISSANGRELTCGTLETPTLTRLREQTQGLLASSNGTLKVQEVVADVQELHKANENAGALFQVASQFNLLEMISPQITPEMGVSIYAMDRTQGPACAIAAGAGTIYRNYFVEVNHQRGQTANNQIDCLADVGAALGNVGDCLWRMQNGYALPTSAGLDHINNKLASLSIAGREDLLGRLRIGVQCDTEVTISSEGNLVSQAFCSALPVAYCGFSSHDWNGFARLVLDAAYEATLHAGILNASRTGNQRVFLTLLGGGAFGNETDWIVDAIRRAISRFTNSDLQIGIVSYGSSRPAVNRLVQDFYTSQWPD